HENRAYFLKRPGSPPSFSAHNKLHRAYTWPCVVTNGSANCAGTTPRNPPVVVGLSSGARYVIGKIVQDWDDVDHKVDLSLRYVSNSSQRESFCSPSSLYDIVMIDEPYLASCREQLADTSEILKLDPPWNPSKRGARFVENLLVLNCLGSTPCCRPLGP